MNKKQLIVLWIGIAVFVLVALTTQTMFTTTIREDRDPIKTWVSKVDYGFLVGRLMSIVVVTGGLIYTLKDKKRREAKG